MMMKSLRCVSLEVGNLLYYAGVTDVDNFLDAFKHEFHEDHHLQELYLALHATPV